MPRTEKGTAGKMAMKLMNVHFSISLSVSVMILMPTPSHFHRNWASHWEDSTENLSVQTNVLKANRKSNLPGSRVWRSSFKAVHKYGLKPHVVK